MNCFGRRLIAYLLVLFLLAEITEPGISRLYAQEADDYLPDEVVVKLVQTTDLANIAVDFGLDPTPIDQFGSRPIYRLRIRDGVTPLEKAAALIVDGRVLYAEPNFLEQTPEGRQRYSWASGGSDGEYVTQWATAKLRLPQAHRTTRGAGVIVAVLDTGVDPTHPHLAGRLIGGYDFVDMDADPREEGTQGVDIAFGHGTHVAGLVALVAPDAKILPVRVLDPAGIGNLWVLAEALAYAVNPDGDPNTDDGADVINLSLSTMRRTELLGNIIGDIICEADDDAEDDDGDDRDYADDDDCLAFQQQGVVVVAAAGNRSGSIPEYPAGESVAGLMAVTASTITDTLTSFANYGSWVQVAAPGDQIVSSVPGGGYGVWSGTSMAAPLAAGVVALVRAADPSLLPPAVIEQIRTTATNIGGPVPQRIDGAAAVEFQAASANHVIYLAVVVSPTKQSRSDDETCNGSLGAIVVDNLRVPDGATCTLNGTRLNGTLKVESNATLWASGVQVTGNIQAENAAAVTVTANSSVGGSIQIKQGGSASIDASHVTGDLQFDSNRSALTASFNRIGGNLQVFQNEGGVTLSKNTIDGNLQCKENNPAPTGGGNIVMGSKEDQCAQL